MRSPVRSRPKPLEGKQLIKIYFYKDEEFKKTCVFANSHIFDANLFQGQLLIPRQFGTNMKKVFENSQSQCFQESWVLNVLQEKRNGTYIEIGGSDGYIISNTSLLEQHYNWTEFALEIDSKRTRKYNRSRRNICINADATTFDYKKYLVYNNFPEVIDYLQVDIEPAFQPLNALLRSPLLV